MPVFTGSYKIVGSCALIDVNICSTFCTGQPGHAGAIFDKGKDVSMAVTFTANGDAALIAEGIRKKIVSEGGKVEGGPEAGSFEVKGFGGAYRAVEGGVEISVTSKPVFVPDSMILSWMRQNLA